MKRIFKYIFMCVCISFIITLASCKKATIANERTIVLEINSSVTPEFSSNFGEGKYDEGSKKYTHKISYIKDLYIYLSADDVKTQTVYIPTSEMNDDVITKEVDFGLELDALIELTVDGVKSLEGLEFKSPSIYSDLTITEGNKLSFKVPNRTDDVNLLFTLSSYKEFKHTITKDELITGYSKINIPAVEQNEIYIGFKKTEYRYEVYSYETNNLISNGYINSSESGIKYVVVPKGDYYVRTSGNKTKVFKVLGEDTIITPTNDIDGNGNIDVLISGINSYSYYIFHKNLNKIYQNNRIYDDLDSIGIIVYNYENSGYYYVENITNKIASDDGNNITIEINENDLKAISVDMSIMNRLTGEFVEKRNEIVFYSDYLDVTVDGDDFKFFTYKLTNAPLIVEFYDDNIKVGETELQINPYAEDEIKSGTFKYNGRTIMYQFPLFINELIYDSANDCYKYSKVLVNTDSSLVKICIVNDKGYFDADTNAYLLDNELNVIMGTQNDYGVFFEVEASKEYTLNYQGMQYKFTTTEENLSNGAVVIFERNSATFDVSVPEGYEIIIDRFNITYKPNSNGIISIPEIFNYNHDILLSNGNVSVNLYLEHYGVDVLELKPFVTTPPGYDLQLGPYYAYEDECYYYYYDESGEIYPPFLSSNNGWYSITLEDFVYDEELKAYYLDVDGLFDHKISCDFIYMLEIEYYVHNNVNGYYYMDDENTITYKGQVYDLSDYDSKNLLIELDGESLKITELN